MKINWWTIGDSQNLTLDNEELDFIKEKIEEKFGSLDRLGKELSVDTALYNKFEYKTQGISVILLKKILKKIGMPYHKIGNKPIKVGRYNHVVLKFPIRFNPEYGEILAHAFFDGYADNYSYRYSNYDPNTREEFLSIVRKAIDGEITVNKPTDITRDIDLPSFVPKLLKSIFCVKTFYSDKCSIPMRFFNLVRKNKLLGWYFLKGAYIDEGTTTGCQIWIVRGIKNKKLATDVCRLADLLGISTKIKLVKSDYYYGVVLANESCEKFYKKVSVLTEKKPKKWVALKGKIEKSRIYQKRKNKVIDDCKKILSMVSKRDITMGDIQNICDIPPSTAFFRVYLLIFNGNVGKRKKGKKNIYFLISKDLSNLPNQNEMRREFGWI